jgi:hypothetical protein
MRTTTGRPTTLTVPDLNHRTAEPGRVLGWRANGFAASPRARAGTINRENAVVDSKDESHYAMAKYLIGRKDKRIGRRLPGGQLRDATDQEIAQAQVHATLALVDVMRELLSELVAGRQPGSDSQV